MIHEERVKLMTRMASYEQTEHKKNQKIIRFFRSDYISLEILKTIVASTIAFGIMFVLYMLYDLELFMKEIYQMDLFQFARSVIILYLIFVGILSLVTYIVALYRYNRAWQSTKFFYANLKKMSQMYEEEKGN